MCVSQRNVQEGVWDHHCTQCLRSGAECVCLPGFTLGGSGTEQRRLASAGQRGTREEKRQGGKERRGGQGMENVKRNFMGGGRGGGGIESQPQNMSHCELSSFFLKKISIPALFLPVRGGALRNYRNAAGVFPTLLRCNAGTHTHAHTQPK